MDREDLYFIVLQESEKASHLPNANKRCKYYLKKGRKVKWITENVNPNNRKAFYTAENAFEYTQKGSFAKNVLNDHDGYDLLIEHQQTTIEREI